MRTCVQDGTSDLNAPAEPADHPLTCVCAGVYNVRMHTFDRRTHAKGGENLMQDELFTVPRGREAASLEFDHDSVQHLNPSDGLAEELILDPHGTALTWSKLILEAALANTMSPVQREQLEVVLKQVNYWSC